MGPLPLGSRVHNSLEAFYKDGSNPVEVYKALLEVDENLFAMSEDYNDEAMHKKFESEAELGRLMLEGYLEWLDETGADAQYEVVSVENKISTIIHDGRVELQGKTDMIVRDKMDGARLILDHKTAATFNDYYKTSHMSEQLMLYCMIEKMRDDGDLTPVEGGVYNLLRKTKRTATAKPPFYERITVRFNTETLRSYWVRVNGVVRDMMAVRDALDAGEDHKYVAYPSPTKDCTWKCPFFQACPMFDDGSSVESWLTEFTEQHNPYERYEDNGDKE